MYARVASFESRDPSLADELIGRVREQVSSGQNVLQNARGFLMLLDRESGKSLGISFFDSEEHIKEAEPAFDRMGDEFPEKMRGRRVSVETYEVALVEGGEGARAARLSTLESAPERIIEGARYVEEEIVPRVRELEGNKGMVSLIDRKSGRTKVITLWESSEALRASEQSADQLRQRAAEGASARIVGVKRYEVGVAERLAQIAAAG
ncbi:MAG: hypothetical protein WBB74_12720 [Gaiellaceae bacterium]